MFSPAFSYMQPFERVRRQWHAFEQWVETVPRVAMEKEIFDTLQSMDAKWNATSARLRPSKQDHEKSKSAFRRELEDGLVTLAREEWQRRLQEAGLKDEDWGDMTFKETLAVERLLGGDLDEEGMAIMESVARADDVEAVVAHAAVPLTNAARASNLSGYSFVSPMSLSIGEFDDEPDAYESIFASEILPSSAPESIVDEIFDTPTSVPWGWTGDSRSYGIWSADTSQSSRQSSQTGSPERPPHKPISVDHAFFPRISEPLSQFQPESASSHRTRGPRYIGPQLTDDEPAFDDEADFERFKMETRVTKIREFHEAAAQADIQLAQDIYNARKTSGTRADDEQRRIAEHEKRMVELRRSKEEERKEIVRTERVMRREAIVQRQLRNTPTTASAAESPRQRLTQEVESKLKSGSGSIVSPDPVVPSAQTRRERRQSQSTIGRSSRPMVAPEPERLAASVPDLLEALTSRTSSTASSTPVSISGTSSSTSSSQTPARWLPPPEIVKATVSTKASRKRASSTTVNFTAPVNAALSATTVKQKPSVSQGQTPFGESPGKPISSVAEPAAPVATPTGPSPAAKKSVISSASSSASKAPSPPTASKGPSPPAASKVPTPPAASKVPSPPAASTVSSPPAPSKVPSPPVTKGQGLAQPKRQPAPSKPSPPTSVKAQSPPAPPAETPKPPKPSEPVKSASTLPQKKPQAQAVEIETPGASSSRTTLEQMQRPFMHKSLGSDSWVASQRSDAWSAPQMDSRPPPAPPGGPVWVSSSSAAKKFDTLKAAPLSTTSHSAQIEKSTSMPTARLPALARPRRMSDPVSPSPRSFAFPDGVQADVKPVPGGPPSIMKKGKGKAKAKRVTIEEISDEEDADTQERLPIDSKIIFEPKPSVPPAVFSQIIDFAPTPPPAASATIPLDEPSRPGNPRVASKESDGQGGFLTGDGKLAKDKHVRWTPSTVGSGPPQSSLGENVDLRAALEALETNVLSPPNGAPGKKGARSRAGSLLQSTTTGRKGKGKERA
ncbi:hypothetical protein DFH06DRAFT_1219235 [Mycena polygramma]|nr:hypothetical protein DFH06DRAFT_1219235 [Mycena polygramma]